MTVRETYLDTVYVAMFPQRENVFRPPKLRLFDKLNRFKVIESKFPKRALPIFCDLIREAHFVAMRKDEQIYLMNKLVDVYQESIFLQACVRPLYIAHTLIFETQSNDSMRASYGDVQEIFAHEAIVLFSKDLLFMCVLDICRGVETFSSRNENAVRATLLWARYKLSVLLGFTIAIDWSESDLDLIEHAFYAERKSISEISKIFEHLKTP